MTQRGQITVHARQWFEAQRSRFERVPQAVVRELVQNASDGLFRTSGDERCIRISVSRNAFTVRDTGVGMDAADLLMLETVGASGTRRQAAEGRLDRTPLGGGRDPILGSLEGRFGVGFYATALIAEQVVVRTRRRDSDEAHEWRFFPADFSFEKCEIDPEREHGTSVEVQVRTDCRDFLSEERLAGLVREVADFVTWPIYVEGLGRSEPVNRQYGPWDIVGHSDYANSPVLHLQFLRGAGLLAADDSPLFLAPLPWDAELGIGGVLFLPQRAEGPPGVAVHLNRYFVNRSTDYLPEGFRSLHGVVMASGLGINESRERLLEDERLEEFQRRLERWIICGDPRWQANAGAGLRSGGAGIPHGGVRAFLGSEATPEQRGQFQRHAGPALLRAAARSDCVLAGLGDVLQMPVVGGQQLSVRELEGIGAAAGVLVLRDETLRSTAVALAGRGAVVLDGTQPQVWGLLERLRDGLRLQLRVIGPELHRAQFDAADWLPLERLLLGRLGDWVGRVTFEGRGHEPAIQIDLPRLRELPLLQLMQTLGPERDPLDLLRADLSRAPADLQEMHEKLVKKLRDLPWPVIVNVDSPVAGSLLAGARCRAVTTLPAARCALAAAILALRIPWGPHDQRRLMQMQDEALADLACTGLQGGVGHEALSVPPADARPQDPPPTTGPQP